MKLLPPLLLAILAVPALAQDQEPPDPTRSSPRMKAALMAGGSAVPPMTVRGVVLSAARESGAVMFEGLEGGRVLARPGVAFTAMADGEPRKLLIKRIGSEGIEIEAVAQKETVIIPGFGPSDRQRGGSADEVDYVEFRDLPLLDALQMLSDQTGLNFSASAEANKIAVNAMLRNVPAASVVEELCKSHGLWFKRDERSRITRIMTVAEFEKDLVGYREEQTEVFTLKYPNVTDVAHAIADLYGDRVQFSIGAEETDEDLRRDLEGRFDRFDVLTQRTQQANLASGSNVVGGNVSGFVNNGGAVQGFGGFNGGWDRIGQNGGNGMNRMERRRTPTDTPQTSEDEQRFRSLTPDQAQRVERAVRSGGDVEALRKRPASIFVTASRRNNQVMVRTADANALEEIRKLVTRLDVQTPLVLMEVKVLSIELGNTFESAVDYQFTDGRVGGSFSTGAIRPSVATDPITGLPTSVIALPGAGSTGLREGQFIFQYLGNSVRARIQMFEQKNKVKTIASPTLLTANNEVSRLFLGEERPLVRGINSQTIITDNNVATTPTTQTEFRNIGNTLLITPNINSDRTVTLRLVQENSFINPAAARIPVVTADRQNSSSVQQVEIDTVGSRTISGTFVAKDGTTVAAGGLIEDIDRKRRGQVPILGDIPGLGFFFQRNDDAKIRRELVVLIRPYILSTPADGERITRDLLDRLAPNSVEKLKDEGFLAELPAVLPKPPGPRPPASAAATRKIEATPTPKVVPPAKKTRPATELSGRIGR